MVTGRSRLRTFAIWCSSAMTIAVTLAATIAVAIAVAEQPLRQPPHTALLKKGRNSARAERATPWPQISTNFLKKLVAICFWGAGRARRARSQPGLHDKKEKSIFFFLSCKPALLAVARSLESHGHAVDGRT